MLPFFDGAWATSPEFFLQRGRRVMPNPDEPNGVRPVRLWG